MARGTMKLIPENVWGRADRAPWRGLEPLSTTRDDGSVLHGGALMHGFDSGEALHEADPRTLSPIIASDRAHVLREFRATTQDEGRRLGRACLALTGQRELAEFTRAIAAGGGALDTIVKEIRVREQQCTQLSTALVVLDRATVQPHA